MKILICFGTRPEWLKIKPLLKFIDSYELLFTGQHLDLLKDIKSNYIIKIQENSNRLDQVISDCLLQFPEGDFDAVLVQGDTASAFACALAAFNRKKKIYYLESGLRSFDMDHPYPEEAYRQMISRIADINFCPTELSKQNLINEKVNGDIFVVGNTILDNLISYKQKCCYENKILITLHRRENHEIMDRWFSEINKIAKEKPDIEFILPIHPNPNVKKFSHILTNVKIIDPLNHNDLLELMAKCLFIISDSGGIQEEATFLNKKVIVCRKNTERPEGIETGHIILCDNPIDLYNIFDIMSSDFEISKDCPYGDGFSSPRIADILKKYENF